MTSLRLFTESKWMISSRSSPSFSRPSSFLQKHYGDWMHPLNVIFLGYFLVSSDSWHRLGAQEPAPRNRITLDASLLAGGLSYARLTSSDKLVGAGAGVGTEFSIRMVHGEKWGKTSTEFAHVDMFTRLETPGRWQYDLGLKAAADIHSQAVHGQSGSEAVPGGFLGGYIAPMWGWRQFRVGPRVQAGVYWTPGPSFGIGVTPLTARFLFKF